jgi:hypothetical protein
VIDASVTRDDLQSLSTADLRRELSAALELTAQTLRRLAAIVRILEDRGEDLSDLRLGFLGYVRQVAHGQVAPEVVVRFAESPLLIRRVAALPMPDQVRLASGEPVDLVVIGPNGRPDTRRVDPLNLGRDQIVQVFSPTGIRDISEQILIVESRSQKPPKAKTGKTIVGKVTVDRERGGIVVGRTFVPLSDVVDALAKLQEPDDDREEDDDQEDKSSITVYVTPTQHDAIKQHALNGRTKVARLVRRALIAHGLLS